MKISSKSSAFLGNGWRKMPLSTATVPLSVLRSCELAKALGGALQAAGQKLQRQ